MKRQLATFLCFLLVTINCLDNLNTFVEEDNFQTHWKHFRENAKQSITLFREYLHNVNVDDIIHSINKDQFLIFYTGRISTGKTTSAATTIVNGKNLLPSKFEENTCIFLFIKSDNLGDNIRLSIQEGENERVLESFPGSSFSPLDAENINKRINKRIEEENQKCMNMNSVEDVKKIFTTNLVLYVPKMRIDNFSHKITLVDIGGYNVFEGSDISTEIKNQALQKFASKADAAILMLKIDDLVGGDTIEKDLENLFKDRKDLASSKQLILVFNFLEGCLDGSKIKLSDPEQPADCTKFLSQLARKRIDEIAKKHTNWKLDIPDENIFILGLRYAQDGLTLKDSNLDDQGKIKDSNIEFFFKRLEKMVKTELENKIISSTQRTIQLTSNSISAIDSDVVSIENNISGQSQVLNELSEMKKIALSHFEKFASILKIKVKEGIDNTLKNLDTKINTNEIYKRTLSTYLDTIRSNTRSAITHLQMNLLDPFNEYDSKISTITHDSISPPAQNSISKVREISLENVILPPLVLNEWTEQIRSKEICGKHWHHGAKQCTVQKSKYENSASDANRIFSIYEERIDYIRKDFGSFVEKNSAEMIRSFKSQIETLQQKKDHLLNHKSQLEKLKDESNTLFNSVKENL